MEWSIVRCMDGRLNPHVATLVRELGIPEVHDLISLSGGCRELTDPNSRPSTDLANVSMDLHVIENTLLIQHTDCGAYGGRAACGETEEADRNFQLQELKNAMIAVHERHPDLIIHAALIHLHNDGRASIEMVSL